MNILINNKTIAIDKLENPNKFKVIESGEDYIKLSDGSKTWKMIYQLNKITKKYDFFCEGKFFNVSLKNISNVLHADSEENKLEYLSPMPGKISKVMVKLGQQVKKGDVLLYLEAMKMEHPIKAATVGSVDLIIDVVGQQVDQNTVLVKLKKL